MLSISRSCLGTREDSCAEWTFSFDRKNRLRTHTYAGGSNVRGNICYDGMGRVWQRWNDDSVSGDWDETLMRYVYDGNTLAQEHQFLASGNGMWIYNYSRYDRDYLHKPGGVRQRSYVGPTSYTDDFLFRDMADIAAKVPRGSSATVTRAPRMASGERTPENDLAPTTSSFTDISRLGAHGAFTECYGGGTTNPRTQGFDALQQSGGRHYLPAIGQGLSAPASSGSRRTIARPSDTSPQQDIVPGDITGPDDPALAEFYKELRYYSWLPNSELACSCDEACENGAECENITHCWQRQCFVTVIPEEPVIDPDTDIECGIHCPAVGVCPEVNCDYWTASLWCCPCNDCPPVGTPITINGKQHEVIQTDLCPDDYAIARMGICDDETLDCVAGIWPFEIPGSIPDAVIELLRRLGEENLWNPNCPNVIFTLTGAHAFSFHGHSGNIFFIERCLQCHCAAVRTGLYGENSPCD